MHLPLNRIPTCAEAVDQHQQLGGRLKHFSSFGTDPLRQSREKQAQREPKYCDRFISEEKKNIYRHDQKRLKVKRCNFIFH